MAKTGQVERGKPGEMTEDGISPVAGDIERETAPASGAGATTRILRGLSYPLARDDMVREAADHGAPRVLLDHLSRLPNRTYESSGDVAVELSRCR